MMRRGDRHAGGRHCRNRAGNDRIEQGQIVTAKLREHADGFLPVTPPLSPHQRIGADPSFLEPATHHAACRGPKLAPRGWTHVPHRIWRLGQRISRPRRWRQRRCRRHWRPRGRCRWHHVGLRYRNNSGWNDGRRSHRRGHGKRRRSSRRGQCGNRRGQLRRLRLRIRDRRLCPTRTLQVQQGQLQRFFHGRAGSSRRADIGRKPRRSILGPLLARRPCALEGDIDLYPAIRTNSLLARQEGLDVQLMPIGAIETNPHPTTPPIERVTAEQRHAIGSQTPFSKIRRKMTRCNSFATLYMAVLRVRKWRTYQ